MAVWINEFHYDNVGSDVGEFIEIAGAASDDPTGWSVVLYNGNNGAAYNTITLGAWDSTLNGAGFQTLNLPPNGLQNGAPDGIALVDDLGNVVEFISYEGSFAATDGPAAGMTSTDIGVEESGVPVGHSLQRVGTGDSGADFTWAAAQAGTPGLENTGQTIGTTPPSAWINEFHYDNAGSDVGEFIEVAGPAGLDLTGWSVVLYNGSNGTAYNTFPLSGALTDTANGFGFVTIQVPSLQNGAPDGIALIDDSGNVVEFLSYEGTMTATDGPAAGETSTDVGVAEPGAIGESLQRVGTGDSADDFTWAAPAAETPGNENTGQTLVGGSGPAASITVTETDGSTDVEEGVSAPDTIFLTFDTPLTEDVTINFTTDGQVAALTWLTVPAGYPIALPFAISVSAVDDTVDEPTSHTGTISFEVVTTDPAYQGVTIPDVTVNITDNDVTLIHEIQGAGLASAMVGDEVTVEAVVTGVLTTSSGVLGYFLQEEDADADADTATSEGIFVFQPGATVSVGDTLRVDATVAEFSGNTQLTNVSAVATLDTGTALPITTVITIGSEADYEAVEGMRVELVSAGLDPLTVIQNFNLDRFGQVTVSEGTQVQPTQVFDPDTQAAEIAALADANADNRLIIDDGSTAQNPDTYRLIDSGDGTPLTAGDPITEDGPTLRLGSEMASIEGIMDQRFGDYRVQADAPLEVVPGTGERPDDLPGVGGDLQVASFNVLNFFTTLDDGSLTGPDGDLRPRGADNAGEYARQLDKLVDAILELEAEVIGLQELENNGFGPGSAIAALVDALNAELGATVYAFVDPGTGFVGTDAITTGIIYKPDAVTVTGSSVLVYAEPSADATFAAAEAAAPGVMEDFDRNRPTVAATFVDQDGSEFTVAVNHFKSKGDSNLENALEAAVNANAPLDLIADLIRDPNYDQGDGQGFWNQVRTDAALELAEWLQTNPTGASSTENLVVLGDLNAYAQEDPVQALIEAGFTDLAQALIGPEAYSYVFDGQQGTLDYAMTSEGLYDNVTWVTEWHIAADEPDLLNYDTTFKDPAFFNDDEFAASDHDPVVFGLELDDPTVNTRYEFVSNRKNIKDKVKYYEDGERVDVAKVWTPQKKLDLDDQGILIDAHDGMRGWEKLTIDRFGLGVWSEKLDRDKSPWGGGWTTNNKDARQVNDGEGVSFKLDDGAGLGDALEVDFEFKKVKGSGEVTLHFFDNRQLVEKVDLTIVDGELDYDLFGNTSFDRVKITAQDDTKFHIKAVEFERLIPHDTFDFV